MRHIQRFAVNTDNVAVGQPKGARTALVIPLQLNAVYVGSVQAVVVNVIIHALAVVIYKLTMPSADNRGLHLDIAFGSVVVTAEGHITAQRNHAWLAAAVND